MTADKIINIALADVGYKESPAGSNRTKYGEAYGWNGVPWCVIFLWDCFRRAGASDLFYGGGKTASCGQLRTYAKQHGQWVTGGYKRGDLAIFDFANTGVETDHIGIVSSVTAAGVVTIEGNTSATGSQSNGGMVMQKTRPFSQINGAYRPAYNDTDNDNTETDGDEMNTVKGSTENEKAMIKAIQSAVGALADGEIGTQTMSDIARLVDADCFPLTLEIYGMPVIIAKNIVPFNPSASLAGWKNVISGSFSVNGKPCSIWVQDGFVRQKEACHAWYGKPESVIYKLKNGDIGIKRVVTTDELPDNVRWAVGGVGLLNMYDPVAEGFTKLTKNGKTEDFSDVLRDTNHTVLGVKGGMCYLVYCKSMTGAQVNAFAKKLGLEMAVMLDGGHVAAINGTEGFAQINTKQIQYYAIQGEYEK